MKLLAKTAEERYQTAAGVEADLRRCLAEWESHSRIDPFLLGAYDVSDRLQIPQKLYGRERDIDTLLASFDRVATNGTPELVLVSGYAGIGKSSVVNELHRALVPSRGLFASGKFEQYKRDIPYATLAQAFQSLVRPILGQSEAELGRWRNALREALGPNGQLIVNLVPELELVIGKQPPVRTCRRGTRRNASSWCSGGSSAFSPGRSTRSRWFLDDLQWLDAATLDLLEHLVTHSEVRHLLLVGAYRDNEVSPSHRLCGRWRRSAKPERGSRRSCWRPSSSTMSDGLSPMPCIASRSALGPWHNWCRRRPAPIRSSRSSSSPRWPKRGCSRSTRSRGLGNGTWIASAPRATPITWWISWPGS